MRSCFRSVSWTRWRPHPRRFVGWSSQRNPLPVSMSLPLICSWRWMRPLCRAVSSCAFAEMKDPVKDKLKRFGLYSPLGEHAFFPTVEGAVSKYVAAHGASWCPRHWCRPLNSEAPGSAEPSFALVPRVGSASLESVSSPEGSVNSASPMKSSDSGMRVCPGARSVGRCQWATRLWGGCTKTGGLHKRLSMESRIFLNLEPRS